MGYVEHYPISPTFPLSPSAICKKMWLNRKEEKNTFNKGEIGKEKIPTKAIQASRNHFKKRLSNKKE